MLQELPKDVVQRNLELHKQIVSEDPGIEMMRGPFHDMVLYYSSIFATINQQAITDAMRILRVGRLLKAPEAVSTKLVNSVAADWLVKRQEGSKAAGLITFVFAKPQSMLIPANTELYVGNAHFVVKEAYLVRPPNGNAPLVNDRILTKTRIGWTATVPATAKTIGTIGNIRKGTILRCTLPLHKAFAENDFTGGADPESNSHLLKRLLHGTTGKTLSNRPNIEALVAKHMPNVSLSIIGMGDQEMLRDQRTQWPGSVGGCVDIYVWPDTGMQTWTVEVSGAQQHYPDGSVDVVLSREKAAGVYRVLSVVDDNGINQEVLSELRGIDTDSLQSPIMITKIDDALYSAVQSITLRLRHYEGQRLFVEVSGIPGLTKLQDNLQQRNVVNPVSDILIKAPVLCHVGVKLVLQCEDNINIGSIKQAIVKLINALGFASKLSTTAIIVAITKLLHGAVIKQIVLTSNVQLHNGLRHTQSTETLLTIPAEVGKYLTARNMIFVSDPSKIEITTVSVDA